jgi:hypothetical protein
MRYFITIVLIAVSQISALAQDSVLNAVQQQLDWQKVLKKDMVYSYSTLSYIQKLDKTGRIEKTDTVVSWHKYKGDSLLEFRVISSTDKDQYKEPGKNKRQERIKLPKLTDPNYDYSVNPNECSITFNPVKPKSGDLAGTISYDPQDMSLKKIDLTMPKLKWPANEFSMWAEFATVDGYIMSTKTWMQAGWNAVISRGRIRVESSNSDYKIYK